MTAAPMTSKIKLHSLIKNMPIEEYHSPNGAFSSSQFKDLLGNVGQFVRKHIKRETEREENDAFDIGTYFHTSILEPHKLKQDCIVYPGKIRRGSEWESFKVKHKGKAIVTNAQKEQAEGLVKAIKNSPICQEKLEGQKEVSLFTEINVHDGQIYAPYYGKKLTRDDGWIEGPKKKLDGHHKIVVKVRADNLGKRHIGDLKSTTGDAESEMAMADKVRYYGYDLSAALYLDMFSLLFPDLESFWLLFASKDMFNARAHEIDAKYISIGRAKYMKAMIRMTECVKNDWQSVDSPGVIVPSMDELRWLQDRDSDLL